MKEKLKNDKFAKELLYKFLAVLMVASVALLMLNVLSENKDGRRQIVDDDGGTEYVFNGKSSESEQADLSASREEQRLSRILSQIKGVGTAEVMITYGDTEQTQSVFSGSSGEPGGAVKGVIVAAEGAGDPVVKNDIINAVTSVFKLPSGSVMVFEKNSENGGYGK